MMKKILFPMLLILIVVQGGAVGSVLSTAATNVAVGSWTPITTNLSYGMIHNGPTMDLIWHYGSRLHWDPVSQQLMFVGSAHGAGSKFIVYDVATNVWREELTCREPQEGANRFGHAYDMRAYDNDRGLYWVHTYNAGPMGHYLFHWSPATKEWDSVFCTGTSWDNSNTSSLAYFPDLHRLVAFSGSSGTVSLMNPDSLIWRSAGSVGGVFGFEVVLCYNAKRKCMVLGGGDNGSVNRLYTLDTNKVLRNLGAPPVTIGAQRASELVCDPATGDIILIRGDGGQKYYTFEDSSWHDEPLKPAVLANFNITATEMIVGTIPEYNIHVILTSSSYPMLLYKHAAPVAVEQKSRSQAGGFSPLAVLMNPCQGKAVLSCAPEVVALELYQSNGRLVRRLTPDGLHRIVWDGRDSRGQRQAAGVYQAVAKLPHGARQSVRLVFRP